jgi:hypothetical protein
LLIEANFELEKKRQLMQAEQAHEMEMNKIRAAHLKTLHNDLGVDVTKYLVAQYQQPDKLFKISSESSASTTQQSPQLHFHQ